MLVFDEDFDTAFPRNFRSTNDVIEGDFATLFSLKGLNNLHASASAQFSEESLQSAFKKIPSKNIWLIDLRRESHGFINGFPISWYEVENQSNHKMSAQQIVTEEKNKLLQLKKEPVAYINKILHKNEGNIKNTQSYTLRINRLETEGELATRLKYHYLRLPVPDHHRPNNQTVDEFIAFVKQLPPDAWLHFHCRGGKGRSSTFIMMYDILRNGHDVSLDDIVVRQSTLGGNNLFKISDKKDDAWKKDAATERKKFLMQFYEYATSKEKGYPNHTFSEYTASL